MEGLKAEFKEFCNMSIESGLKTGTVNIVFAGEQNAMTLNLAEKTVYVIEKPLFEYTQSEAEEIISGISANAVLGTEILFVYALSNIVNSENPIETEFCCDELYMMLLLEKYGFVIAEESAYNEYFHFVNASYYNK